MSGLAGIFLRMAASGGGVAAVDRPVFETLMVSNEYCHGKCGLYTPHLHKNGYLECAWCLNKIYGTASAH